MATCLIIVKKLTFLKKSPTEYFPLIALQNCRESAYKTIHYKPNCPKTFLKLSF